MIKFIILVMGILSPFLLFGMIFLPMIIYKNLYKKAIVQGIVLGAISGFLIGRYIYLSFLAELLYGNLSKYAIRIDALFWTALFTSLGMIIGSVASDSWSKSPHGANAARKYSHYLFLVFIAFVSIMIFFIFLPIKK